MLNSCSVNTVQGIQGTGLTSLRNRSAYIHLLIASNPFQDMATGLYRTNVSVYSQKEFPAMDNPPLPSSMVDPHPPACLLPQMSQCEPDQSFQQLTCMSLPPIPNKN